ncbi:hypothetical protein [Clostridium sp. JS66]|uniref:hypothetical protein n=1 Tax=Clostridium sp. JS66 TaxID=3064705 RepID=UPI00298E85CB|nr:hypothetical protein [Clostridium sp. JS66]WPC43903.1 hypothetical protein Q6H37_10625 [Clostridium sp. JS66]
MQRPFFIFTTKNKRTRNLAVFSAAQIINASIPEDIHALIDDKDLVKYGWTMASLCQYYLEWSYLIDMKNEVAIEYSDLYEPIIKLFERGGKISYHQNELICGGVGWPHNCYSFPRKVFIEEINNQILDNINLEYKY